MYIIRRNSKWADFKLERSFIHMRMPSNITINGIGAGTCLLAAALTLLPYAVIADDEVPDSVAAEVGDYTSKVEETGRAYDDAVAVREELEKRISELENEIAEKEKAMPALNEKAADSAVALYKERNGLPVMLSMLADSNGLADMLYRWDSCQRIISYHRNAVDELAKARDSLVKDKEQLDKERADANVAEENARATLEEAKEERQAAVSEAMARQESEATRKVGSSTPGISAGEINWNVSKKEFIDTWAPRIDAYLAGSPMEGMGNAYATAAWAYGCDPRWAPAISTVESTTGRVCFREHNAWGYGSRDFASWEEGIDTVVKALASSLYGGSLTYEAASTYCPPNTAHWYNTCASEMAKIG